MSALVTLEIPIRTAGGLNSREHWRVKAKRVASERRAVAVMFPRAWVGMAKDGRPLVVTMVRRSAGTLDDDNLQGSLKAVRDELAKLIGVDDGNQQVRWLYRQEKAKRGHHGVSVGFEYGIPVLTIVREAR